MINIIWTVMINKIWRYIGMINRIWTVWWECSEDMNILLFFFHNIWSMLNKIWRNSCVFCHPHFNYNNIWSMINKEWIMINKVWDMIINIWKVFHKNWGMINRENTLWYTTAFSSNSSSLRPVFSTTTEILSTSFTEFLSTTEFLPATEL